VTQKETNLSTTTVHVLGELPRNLIEILSDW